MADVLTTRELVVRKPRPSLADLHASPFDVSTKSQWRQPIWRLDSEQGGFEWHTIDFRRAPAAYANTAKMWAWTALGGVGPVAATRVSSVVAMPEKIHSVFGFMSVCARRVDGLIPAHFRLFVARLKNAYPIDENGVGPPEGPIRAGLSIWRDLWDQRQAFTDAGMAALSFDPFEHQSFTDCLASFGCRDTDQRPPLPDDVEALLFVSSEQFLEFGQDVASLQTRILNMLAESGGEPTPEMLAEIRRGPFRPVNGRPWHVVPDGVKTAKMAIRHLRMLIGLVEGAMAHLIFHEIGLRPSEYVSPLGGYEEGAALPRCVEAIEVPDQGVTLYLLHGTLYKLQQDPVPSVWAMGVTSIGTNLPPPSVRAIELLDWINAPWRDGSDKLLVRFNFDPAPCRRRRTGAGTTNSKVRDHLKRFYSQVDWSTLQIDDAEVAAIVEQKGQEIVPTNMRKSFAGYFVRLDDRLLGPVSVQLKHDSEEETDIDYVMNDPAMLEPAREFASREVARIMLQMSGATAAAAAAMLPATHIPHLADIAALRDECEGRDMLEMANRIVIERDLSRPRQSISQSVVPPLADRVDALMEQYRVLRPIWLNAIEAGRRREHDAFRSRSERLAARLLELGIDPPTDQELKGKLHA